MESEYCIEGKAGFYSGTRIAESGVAVSGLREWCVKCASAREAFAGLTCNWILQEKVKDAYT